MTDLDRALDAFDLASSASEAKMALGPVQFQAGLSRGYFDRVLATFGGDSARSIELASRWKLIVAHGDEPQFAYRARAIGEWLQGHYLAAAQSFQEAGRRSDDKVEALSFQIGAIDALARAGRIAEAARLGRRLARGLERLGSKGEAGRAWLNVGNALTQADRHSEAAAAFLNATALLNGQGFDSELASALIGLSTCEIAVGRFESAVTHAERAQQEFGRLGKEQFADLARVNIGYLQLLSGQTGDALSLLDELRGRLAVPGEAGRLDELLGDVLFELNRPEEARASYKSARSSSTRGANPRRANALFGLARTGFLLDDPLGSQNLREASRLFEKLGNETMMAECQLLQAEQLSVRRLWKASLQHARAVAEVTRRLGATRTRVRALLKEAEASIRLSGEDANLDTAGRLINRHGFVGLKWRVSYLRAEAAPERRRVAYYRRMFREILESRLLANTALGRASFLDDKKEALGKYLSWLIGHRRAGWQNEVLSVISQSRSAALLDEILSARAAPELIEELQKLRREFSLAAETEGPGSGARLGGVRRTIAPEISARWIRAQGKLRLASTGDHFLDPNACVFIEVSGQYHALESGRYFHFGISLTELKRHLAKLAFELDGPLVDADADPAPAYDLIRSLKATFEGPMRRAISPDGLLWRVPWQVLNDQHEEITLLPSPAFGSCSSDWQLPSEPSVAIWAGPGLEFVEQETENLMSHFPEAKVFRTAAEVRANLDGQYDLIHVAGHAHYSAANPMFSQIEFRDDAVSGAEIAASGLRVGCAVLFACNSGRLSARSPMEPDGLVRAFLARSANVAVASSWPLSDQAACLLSKHLYDLLSSGQSINESVQLARRMVRKEMPHPFYWGAPVIFGGYSRPGEYAEAEIELSW